MTDSVSRTRHDDQPATAVPPSVLVVPLNYAGEVLFTHAPAIDGGPAGRELALPFAWLADGDDPAQAAMRALQSATGFRAEAVFPLGALAPFGRWATGDVHLFLARNLEPAGGIGAAAFGAQTERVPFGDLETLIAAGRLRDATLIAALFIARQAIAGHIRFDDEGAQHG